MYIQTSEQIENKKKSPKSTTTARVVYHTESDFSNRHPGHLREEKWYPAKRKKEQETKSS
jgi:hypothetical protein